MLDKYQGTLLGLAVGDALGGPLEFMSQSQIHIKHGEVCDFIGGGWLGLRPGEYTDDTQMMIRLAESLVERGELDCEDVARRYVQWYQSSPKDIGNATRAALAAIAEGASVKEASRIAHDSSNQKTAGNGTVMRTAPLALRYWRDRERLAEASMEEARITHYDRKAGVGSAAVNLAISLALEGETDRWTLVRRTADLLDEGVGGTFSILPDFDYRKPEELRPSGYVVDTLEVAFYYFLNTDDFEECLVRVVNLGGDADTIGAVAGSIAGAFYGLQAIPKRWTERLSDRGMIAHLARELHRLAMGGEA